MTYTSTGNDDVQSHANNQGRSRTRLAAAVLGALALTLSACGSDSASSDDAASSGAASDEAVSSEAVASGAATDTTALAEEVDSGDEEPEASGDECREIVHTMGVACVPVNPQRIVALDSLVVLPTLLEVGASVLGGLSVYENGEPFSAYLDPAAVADIEVVGSLQAPNIEAIAALEPDLIIGADAVIGSILEQLEQIAPVVVTSYAFYSSTWTEDARIVADAVGKADEYDELVLGLQAHVEEAAAEIEALGGPFTISRVDIFQDIPLTYHFDCVWFGWVLQGAGVTQPEVQQPADCTDGEYTSVLNYLSLETIDALEADAIVGYQQQATEADVGADPLAFLADTPLWNSLAAVQDDNVYVVGDAWGLGVSVTAAHQILDELVNTIFAS